jgi:hypothetical protein
MEPLKSSGLFEKYPDSKKIILSLIVLIIYPFIIILIGYCALDSKILFHYFLRAYRITCLIPFLVILVATLVHDELLARIYLRISLSNDNVTILKIVSWVIYIILPIVLLIIL